MRVLQSERERFSVKQAGSRRPQNDLYRKPAPYPRQVSRSHPSLTCVRLLRLFEIARQTYGNNLLRWTRTIQRSSRNLRRESPSITGFSQSSTI